MFISAVGQSTLLRMWGVESDSAMQALPLGYPLGSLLAPLIAVPFVSEKAEDDDNGLNGTTATNMQTSLMLQQYTRQLQLLPVAYQEDTSQPENYDSYFDSFADDSTIGIAFAICGLFTFSVAIAHVVMNFLKLEVSDKEKAQQQEAEQSKQSLRTMVSPAFWAAGETRFGVTVMMLIVLFYCAHIGSALGIMMYLVTYLTDSQQLQFSNREAALLQAAMNFTATFARAISILIARYVNVNVMLAVELHGQLVMLVSMLVFGTQYATAMWVTSCVYALFHEPTWPSATTLVNNYIIMTSFLFSILSLCTGLFNIVYNLLVGSLYTNVTEDSIFYLGVVFGALNCLVLYAMYFVTYKKPLRQVDVLNDDVIIDKFSNDECSKGQFSARSLTFGAEKTVESTHF